MTWLDESKTATTAVGWKSSSVTSECAFSLLLGEGASMTAVTHGLNCVTTLQGVVNGPLLQAIRRYAIRIVITLQVQCRASLSEEI